MEIGIREIEAAEEKTVGEFLSKFNLSTPVLLEVNGVVFYLDEIKDRKLAKGDKIVLVPLIAGG